MSLALYRKKRDFAKTPEPQGKLDKPGAHLRFVSEDNRWEVTAFGTNLSDERYMTNGLQSYGSFGTADGTFGRPREWGVTLRARF